MPGTGPAPKDEKERRNTRKPLRGEWVDLEPLEEPVLPPLPAGKWEEVTRMTWDAWRRDPVSTQWSPSDVAYAFDAIRMHNQQRPSQASEVRLRMDALGLTPKGKRDLRWRVGDQVSTPTPMRKSTTPKRRAHLSVVA